MKENIFEVVNLTDTPGTCSIYKHTLMRFDSLLVPQISDGSWVLCFNGA